MTTLMLALFVFTLAVIAAVYAQLRRTAKGAVFPFVSMQAGFQPELWAAVYWTAKLFFAVIFGVAVLMTTRGAAGAWAALILTVIGFVVPDLFLLARRKSRQQKIERSLSFFVDLLVSLLRAGMPVEDAFARAGIRGFDPDHPISEEVARTASDITAGVDRAEAYKAFATRTGVGDARVVSSALELGGRLGFGVADILAAHADVLRDKRLEYGRRRIDRATVAALAPVMLCGLPLMVVVVAVPLGVEVQRIMQLIRAVF